MDHPEPDEPPTVPRRRGGLARRIAVVAVGLVVIGGAIVVLRTPEKPGETAPRPAPPPQTTVREFAGDGVVIPTPVNPPAQPAKVEVRPGPQRLQVGWGPPEPVGAAGYEIRWGRAGQLDRVRLVAQPAAQLDALENEAEYEIEIRTVNAFGQRSLPVKTRGTPKLSANEPAWSFADRFIGRVVPDPERWRLSSASDCARATRGDGENGRRMVISAQCGTEPVALRSRAPLRLLESAVDGELGRVVVETDQPGQTGELLIDLVPGPADLIDGSPNGPPRPDRPGLAQDDPALPPGTVRVRVAGQETTTTVQVLVAPGTPRLGTAISVDPAPTANIGVSVRWEVVLRTDGVRVLRDGQVVGGGDVVPAWREATALLGFAASSGGLYAAVDLVAFTGAPTAPPVFVPPPALDTGRVVHVAGSGIVTSADGARVQGTVGGQLRITLVPQNGPDNPPALDDLFTVEVGGSKYATRPAVVGQPLTRGVRYPIVADLPAEALVLGPDGKTLPLRVRGPFQRGQATTRLISASIELTAPPGGVSPAAGSGTDIPLFQIRPALARPGARFLDASGKPIPNDAEVPRGRLVLEVRADGPAGQRLGGELAGLAGMEVRLDGERIAGIPTVVDGPGVAGTWRLAVNTTGLRPGQHTIEIKAIGVDPRAAFAVAYAPFTIG
ncbi:fibronectin type III domain-containing protein [Actinokineospora sp.]|uniref:fibronectin type III domain-containing protein n=1 Tax=Actinokineospora sp. TaxID=1872133 RepID=UPI004037F434